MKKLAIFCICCLVAFFTTATVSAQFTGSSSGASQIRVSGSQITAMTVNDVKNLSKDAPVVLVGNITRALSKSSFTFKDSTGEITVNIKSFGGVQIGDTDRIVIVGRVSINKGAVEVAVSVLMKA